MIGIAPGVRLFSMKVLDANGQGLTSTVLQALEFLLNNRGSLGIDVVNLSLGHPITEPAATDPLVQAVELLSRKGIIVVAAAGNWGQSRSGVAAYAGITSPGNAPSALTVGALDTNQTVTRSDDRVPAYSSRGPTWYDGIAKPDLVAPGHNLVSVAAVGSSLYTRYPNQRLSRWRHAIPSFERHEHGDRRHDRRGRAAHRAASSNGADAAAIDAE